VEEARERVAALVGARREEIVFTSGGTEADNLALVGVFEVLKDRGNHIVTSAVEHHAVLHTCQHLERMGAEVTYVPVDRHGMVDPEAVREALPERTILVSIMHANNEVGTIQPIARIAAIARERGIPFHTDAVQTVGHIPVDVEELGVDLLSISAHKLYGPKGTGALYIRRGTRIAPILHGGEQEARRRSGTENVPGIVGFGKAAEIAGREMADTLPRLVSLRDRLIEGLLDRIPHAWLNGHRSQRLPGNVNLSFDYVEGESIVINLDLAGIAASTGSACSSADAEPSHTLLAMGIPREKAHSSVRFTLGRGTTSEDIERVIEVLPPIIERLRSMSPLLK